MSFRCSPFPWGPKALEVTRSGIGFPTPFMTNASPVRWSRFRILPEIAAPLPMSRAEMEARGWEQCDVILVTGDAYVDHPAFGAAMVGRFLEWLGCRVGVIAQPRPDRVEDFAALGVPKLFWGVTAGNVDSQLARLTVMRKRRRDDPYAAGGLAGRRPPNATIVYTARVRQVGHGVPVVIGGIEASLRRLAYYDYWSDRVRRSLLVDAKADVLVYGMGEPPLADLVAQAMKGVPLGGVPGTARLSKTLAGDLVVRLPSYEAVSAPTEEGREAFSEMTRQIYRYSHPWHAVRLAQAYGDRWVVVEPPPLPLTTEEMDLIYALPFTNRPHPSYGHARIPAWEMIRDSITTHRGCYGECRFCAITVHQGRTISSRSEGSIVAQARRLARDPSFRGTITDLGGPTANMWQTGCRDKRGGCRGETPVSGAGAVSPPSGRFRPSTASLAKGPIRSRRAPCIRRQWYPTRSGDGLCGRSVVRRPRPLARERSAEDGSGTCGRPGSGGDGEAAASGLSRVPETIFCRWPTSWAFLGTDRVLSQWSSGLHVGRYDRVGAVPAATGCPA